VVWRETGSRGDAECLTAKAPGTPKQLRSLKRSGSARKNRSRANARKNTLAPLRLGGFFSPSASPRLRVPILGRNTGQGLLALSCRNCLREITIHFRGSRFPGQPCAKIRGNHDEESGIKKGGPARPPFFVSPGCQMGAETDSVIWPVSRP
jgi:hypothetical protein